MFQSITLLDLLSAVIISLITLFLILIFRVDTILVKPKIYLKLALSMVLIVLLIDKLIELNFQFAVYLCPISYFIYFTIYPVIYVYSRDIVFNGQDSKRPPLLVFMIFPLLVLIIISVLFYPLSFNEKVVFANQHISQSIESSSVFTIFKSIIIPAYYIQTLIYIVLTFMLIDVVKKRNIHSKTFDLLITRYLLIYIIGVIIFEILIIIINTILPISVLEIRLFEMSLTLLFVLFGIYVLFNQKIILIQSRLELYSNKIDSASNGTSSKNILSEAEKLEIKNTIEHFLEESKLYLNPNLTLDLFARKIHIQPRKISKVINLIHNKNFHQFINGYRIAAAIQIMAGQKEINIENLYTKFGFNSRSTFNRVFKEITGKSPSGYLSTHKSSQR